MNANVRTKVVYPLAAVLLGLCAIELLSFGFFTVFRHRFGFHSDYTIARSDLPKLKEQYDFSLGWKKHYPTKFGERPRGAEHGQALLATFGDSFTFCDEVGDGDTWEEQLAQKLSADVYNFGNDGYGTDQAYLRFQQDYPKVRTPAVALGLITENINRIVNRYRPFYSEHTGHSLTKPRFVLRGSTRELMENPIRTPDEIEKLLDPGFVRSLGENDWWYKRDQEPSLGFPYTAILFHKRFWLEAFHRRAGHYVDDLTPRPWANLWTYPPARDLMFSIFDSFMAESRTAGAKPFIMLLPSHTEVVAERQGRRPKKVETVLSFCQEHGYPFFNGASALARNAGSDQEIDKFFVRHLTPLGNKIIAGELAAFLAEQKLMAEPSDR